MIESFFNRQPVKKRYVQYYDAHRNIYSEKHQFLLFKISKVASTSLWTYMAQLLGHDATPRSINLPFIQGWDIHNHSDVFKAGFVRNPWDRLVSCYKQKKKDKRLEFYRKNNLSIEMNFEEFAKAVCEIPDSEADQHFRSQYTFVINRKGELIADFIGRFEYLEDDFKTLCTLANLPYRPLSKKNSTPGNSYTDYYTPELAELVAKRYQLDLAVFGYEFGKPLTDEKRYQWRTPIPEELKFEIIKAKNHKLLNGLYQLENAQLLPPPNIKTKAKKLVKKILRINSDS